MDEREKARGKLVKAHGDTAELLELEEEPFYKMAFLVKPPIDVPRISFTIPGRDAKSASWSAINSRSAHLP